MAPAKNPAVADRDRRDSVRSVHRLREILDVSDDNRVADGDGTGGWFEDRPAVRSGAAANTPAAKYMFRNVSNPAMAAGPNGVTYVAWAERIQSTDPDFGTMVTRDSHIKLSVGTPAKANGNQVIWSPPVTVDSLTPGTQPLRGHQLRPSMWFASGKLYLSAAFLQEDQTAGVFTRQEICDPGKIECNENNPSATPDLTITTYDESREPRGELVGNPPGSKPTATQKGRAFTEIVIDLAPKNPTLDVAQTYQANLLRRHTEEIGVWQGTPGTGANPYPSFTFAKVTRFPMRQRRERRIARVRRGGRQQLDDAAALQGKLRIRWRLRRYRLPGLRSKRQRGLRSQCSRIHPDACLRGVD